MLRWSFALATLNAAVLLAAFGLLAAAGLARAVSPVAFAPALWVWLAAVLSAGDRTHAPLGVTTAAGLCLPLNAYLLAEAYHRAGGGVAVIGPFPGEGKLLAQFPLALAVLVPAAVGWRRRRRARLLADPD